MDRLIHVAQHLVLGNGRHRARSWQARAAAAQFEAEFGERLRFERALRAEPGSGRLILGRARSLRGGWYWAGLPIEEFVRMHSSISGATGTGKTYLLIGLLIQLLRAGGIPVVVADFKGELTSLLLDVVVPALATTGVGGELLDHLRVIRPFDRDHLPMLRITQPEDGVAQEVQAFALASALEETLGDDLGGRMSRTFLHLSRLAVELNEPLTVIRDWLLDPARFARAASRSADPAIRAYAGAQFARENRASVEALLARLDRLFFLPEMRLALAAPHCVSFAEMFECGLTAIDLGEPPAGCERIARFWGGLLLGRLIRAILNRPVTAESPHCVTVLEEVQEGLGRYQVEQFTRALALARYKRAALVFSHQQTSQIAAVDANLLRVLQTNTGLTAAFRCNVEDARAFSHALPVPRASGRDRAIQDLVNAMTRLPDRMLYLWLKRGAPFRAHLIRSPRLDMEALRALAGQASDEARDRIRRGTVSLPRRELEQAERRPAADEQLGGLEAMLHPVERDGGGSLPHLG